MFTRRDSINEAINIVGATIQFLYDRVKRCVYGQMMLRGVRGLHRSSGGGCGWD